LTHDCTCDVTSNVRIVQPFVGNVATTAGSKAAAKLFQFTLDSVHAAVARWTFTVVACALLTYMLPVADTIVAPAGISERSNRTKVRASVPVFPVQSVVPAPSL
jgi:hypothetical protein